MGVWATVRFKKTGLDASTFLIYPSDDDHDTYDVLDSQAEREKKGKREKASMTGNFFFSLLLSLFLCSSFPFFVSSFVSVGNGPLYLGNQKHVQTGSASLIWVLNKHMYTFSAS